jgi:hypothetical protein
MRSNLIHDALRSVQNRYMLCQLASKATRKFHRPNTRIQETMNDVLGRFGQSREVAMVEQPERFASAERRAA